MRDKIAAIEEIKALAKAQGMGEISDSRAEEILQEMVECLEKHVINGQGDGNPIGLIKLPKLSQQ